MGIRRYRTVQGHYVPQHGYHGGGSIFDPEIMREPQKMAEYEPEELPLGATVLNGMRGVPLYQCTECGEVVAEAEFAFHQCAPQEYAETDDWLE